MIERLRKAREFIKQPLVGRIVFWLVVAELALWGCVSFQVAFSSERMYVLFAPKVPFLGLIITAATFQY